MKDVLGALSRLARLFWPANDRAAAAPARGTARKSGTAPADTRDRALALQGGGPLGAFTWGVLETLLTEGGINPVALSGASAGAVNAAVLATHWVVGGPEAATAALERVWRRVSDSARFTPFGDFPLLPKLGANVGTAAIAMATRLFSPYQLNPLDHNPLRDILAAEIDPALFRDPRCPRLFVSATRVSDGGCRIFTNEDLTIDAILASAALPFLNRAVEIDGETYWDGGYTANPPLRPLIAALPKTPILLVELLPRHEASRPRSAGEITARLNRIVFSRPLIDELRALEDQPDHPPIEGIALDRLPGAAQPTLDWPFLDGLRRDGNAAATAWLKGPRPES